MATANLDEGYFHNGTECVAPYIEVSHKGGLSPHLRGRVFSIYLWALQGVTPFGSLLIGWMTQELSLSTTALLCGLTSLVIIGGIQLFRPEVRHAAGAGGLT